MVVYFIAQEEPGKSQIKIGCAKDVKKRHGALQTGNPVQLRIMGWIVSGDDFQLERRLHARFEDDRVRGEWFTLEASDVLPLLEEAGSNGFCAKNANAFEIVGHDKDGIPEFLGVWDWGDLELEECCPFCGCFCGMHYQDASAMYYCLHCQELTNFTELSPDTGEDY